jgi:hypothetical protein
LTVEEYLTNEQFVVADFGLRKSGNFGTWRLERQSNIKRPVYIYGPGVA